MCIYWIRWLVCAIIEIAIIYYIIYCCLCRFFIIFWGNIYWLFVMITPVKYSGTVCPKEFGEFLRAQYVDEFFFPLNRSSDKFNYCTDREEGSGSHDNINVKHNSDDQAVDELSSEIRKLENCKCSFHKDFTKWFEVAFKIKKTQIIFITLSVDICLSRHAMLTEHNNAISKSPPKKSMPRFAKKPVSIRIEFDSILIDQFLFVWLFDFFQFFFLGTIFHNFFFDFFNNYFIL